MNEIRWYELRRLHMFRLRQMPNGDVFGHLRGGSFYPEHRDQIVFRTIEPWRGRVTVWGKTRFLTLYVAFHAPFSGKHRALVRVATQGEAAVALARMIET